MHIACSVIFMCMVAGHWETVLHAFLKHFMIVGIINI